MSIHRAWHETTLYKLHFFTLLTRTLKHMFPCWWI